MSGRKVHHEAEEDCISPSPNKNVITFLPRGFDIVWGNDDRYWRLPAKGTDNSPAELIQVSWLEVTGKTEIETGKKYKISFKLSLKSDAFGWNGCQVYLMAKVGAKGKYKWMKIPLKDKPDATHTLELPNVDETNSNTTNKTLYFGLYEVWSGRWKGGLQIHEAVVEAY